MAQDPYLPWPGNPRRFYAVAMPNGDSRLKIEGQLVFVKENRVGAREPGSILTRAEAEQLRNELNHALGAFDLAKDLARAVACREPYPFRDHRTLADQPDDEAEAA